MNGTRNSSLLGKITVLFVICYFGTGGLCLNTALALDGLGTEGEPWLIQSLEDFDEFASDANYWDGYTRLETDVNLADRTYTTAVIAPDVNNSNDEFDGIDFTGVFDGNDHKIMNLNINDGGVGNDYLGLFGCIFNGGVVMNLGLEGGSVRGDEDVGSLVGGNSGIVLKCYSTGDVSGVSVVGGLIGVHSCSGIVLNCYSVGNVSGDNGIGGLVGFTYPAITPPVSSFLIWYFGDLTEGNSDNSVSNCYSTGSVSGNECIGGLVGCNGGSISNCYSTGDVNGTGGYVGSLVGVSSGSISYCYSTGDVSGLGYVGGLVGHNNDYSSISNCYSTGDVNAAWGSVGGLVGHNNDYGSIDNCYSTSYVSGVYDVGGLIGGNFYYGIVSNCYSTGDVSGLGYVGGLVGWNNDYGSIDNCYSTSYVSGDEDVGGLVGVNSGIVSKCYSTGDVSGDEDVGGLLGLNVGIVSNCYSTGDVSGLVYVGGLVGLNYNDGGVLNCYSIGDVSGLVYVGGLVGSNKGSISNCLWDTDTQTHGVTESIGDDEGTVTNVAGLPTEQMQTKNTFTDAGWDFVNIWDICEGTNYPKFIWQIPMGDFLCPDGVDFFDFSFFAGHWAEDNCGASNDCDRTDLDLLGTVENNDLRIFVDNWLEGF